jgi:23S rRNA pseudouridine1911/1915/1917 synthase
MVRSFRLTVCPRGPASRTPIEKPATVVLWLVDETSHTIVYQDNWVIAANKPAGVPSQHDKSGDEALIDVIERECGGPLYVVHRIDRPASGLVLFARSQESAAHLSDLFRKAEVERWYWAIVGVRPDSSEATLRHRLESLPRSNKSRVVNEGGSEAVLRYSIAAQSDRYWLLNVQLLTGRHHQIRAQLATIGCPIRGDLKYGARRSIPGGGIGLHAYRLSFLHPKTGNQLTLSAPPPEDRLWQALTTDLQD